MSSRIDAGDLISFVMNEETPNPAGGGDGVTSPIDLTSEKDRGLVRRAMKEWPKRWRGLTPEVKDYFLSSLKEADRLARIGGEMDPIKAASALASVVKTAAAMEAQNQADEHMADKNARLDEGKPTEGNAVTVRYVNKIDGSGDGSNP